VSHQCGFFVRSRSKRTVMRSLERVGGTPMIHHSLALVLDLLDNEILFFLLFFFCFFFFFFFWLFCFFCFFFFCFFHLLSFLHFPTSPPPSFSKPSLLSGSSLRNLSPNTRFGTTLFLSPHLDFKSPKQQNNFRILPFDGPPDPPLLATDSSPYILITVSLTQKENGKDLSRWTPRHQSCCDLGVRLRRGCGTLGLLPAGTPQDKGAAGRTTVQGGCCQSPEVRRSGQVRLGFLRDRPGSELLSQMLGRRLRRPRKSMRRGTPSRPKPIIPGDHCSLYPCVLSCVLDFCFVFCVF